MRDLPAASCHATSTRTVHGTSARGMNVDAIDNDLADRPRRAAASGRAVRVQRLDLLPDSLCGLRATMRARPRVRAPRKGPSPQRQIASPCRALTPMRSQRRSARRNPERSQPVAGHRSRRAARARTAPLPAYEICPSPMIAVAISERNLQCVRASHGRSRRRPPRGRAPTLGRRYTAEIRDRRRASCMRTGRGSRTAAAPCTSPRVTRPPVPSPW